MSIDWTAVAAVAACLAAIIALVPIYRESAARKAKAVNLRMRIAVKIKRFYPTLTAFPVPVENRTNPLYLDSEAALDLCKELENLVSESEVLFPDEQDRVTQFLANIEMIAPFFGATNLPERITKEAANQILMIGERAIEELTENGLHNTEPHQPWLEDDA